MYALDQDILRWRATQEKLNGVWEQDISLIIKQIMVLMCLNGMDLAFAVAIVDAPDVDTPEKALKEIFRQGKCIEDHSNHIISRMSRLVFECGNLYSKKYFQYDQHFEDMQNHIEDCPSLYVYEKADIDTMDDDFRNTFKNETIRLIPRLENALVN